MSVVVLLLTVITAYVLTRTSVGTALGVPVAPPPCTVTVEGATREWSRDQAMTATTVSGVGMRIGASVNGVAAAVEADLQAARMTSWTPRPRARSTRRCRPGLAPARLGAAGQGAARLRGAGADLHGGLLRLADSPQREDPDGLGLTPRAEVVRVAMREVFGKQILGGFEPRGVDSGHVDGSAHYEGRAIDVFFRPITPRTSSADGPQAAWTVAHADQLSVATVIFDRAIWTARRSVSGWRDYEHPGGPTDDPILLHEDHVHVDVLEGG